jgi:hypothetical protein
VPAVADLADQRVGRAPDPQDAVAAAVADAVGGQLVDRPDRVLHADGGQAGLRRAAGDERPDVAQRPALDGERVEAPGRRRQRRDRRPGARPTAAAPGVAMPSSMTTGWLRRASCSTSGASAPRS